MALRISRTVFSALSGMRLLACLIVAPQRGYDEPAILSYAISSFCPTSADGLQPQKDHSGSVLAALLWPFAAAGAVVFGLIWVLSSGLFRPSPRLERLP